MRKIIQISAIMQSDERDIDSTPIIYALCNDGSLFGLASWASDNWVRLPDIPQNNDNLEDISKYD